MKRLVAAALVSTLAFSAGLVHAGGPVIVDDADEVVPEAAGSSVGILPILLIGVALCAVLCGGDDETTT